MAKPREPYPLETFEDYSQLLATLVNFGDIVEHDYPEDPDILELQSDILLQCMIIIQSLRLQEGFGFEDGIEFDRKLNEMLRDGKELRKKDESKPKRHFKLVETP